MEHCLYFCDKMEKTPMRPEIKIKVQLMDEATAFVKSLPLKAREKITYNFKKIEQGIQDRELFKKLDGTDIWELRTLYYGNCYRMFSFWDTDNDTLIIATHGIMKKTQKSPLKEIHKAEQLRQQYFENKKA